CNPLSAPCVVCVFFFQAEDGIRDFHVTGVQTCALPISSARPACSTAFPRSNRACCSASTATSTRASPSTASRKSSTSSKPCLLRSEERRVGKECRARGARDDYKKSDQTTTQERIVRVAK